MTSALDNPTNFFTAQSLSARSSDISSLLDGISNGVQAIQAATQGITSITKLLETAKSTASQALADKTGGSSGITGGTTAQAAKVTGSATLTNLGTTDTSGTTTFDLSSPTKDASLEITLNGAKSTIRLDSAATGVTASGTEATDGSSKASIVGTEQTATKDFSGTKDASFTLKLGSGSLKLITLNNSNLGTGTTTSQSAIAKAINDQISADTGLAGKVEASYVNNKLVIATKASGSDQKLTIQAAQVTTGGSAGVDIGFGVSGSSATSQTGAGTDVGGSKGTSSVRSALAQQFNQILQQITQQAQDSGYNGVNLLFRNSNNAADNTLHIAFNEKNTSALDIQGVEFDAAGLGLSTVDGGFQTDTDINAAIETLNTATTQLRTQSSTFGANLSIVQNRQDFSKQLINILDTGSANLVNADLNEEAANSQALSTRNSIATSALSLANQAQQGILQLLR